MQDIPLLQDTHLLLTPSIEYIFANHPTIPFNLLEKEQAVNLTFSSLSSEVSIFPLLTDSVTTDVSPTSEEFLFTDSATIDASFAFEEFPSVSDNLFQPLRKQQVGGKNYRQNELLDKKQLFSDSDTEIQKYSKVDGYRKSFTEIKNRNSTSHKGVDPWDLLFPLLQPPIDTAFTDVLDLPPRCTPYPYQWEGIKFLVERESALLGDDMGTGKTVQSTLACRLLFQRGLIQKALIVSPLSVLAQWDRELEKWAPSLKAKVVRGNLEHRQVCWKMPAHIYLTTYETLRQDEDFLTGKNLNKFDLVILDEAQRIKNRSSGISQAVRKLRARFRWALTGTPIENRIEELASIFAFLRPSLFRSHDVSPAQAQKFIQPFFLRRRKEDVLKDLPAKEEFSIWLRLSDQQYKTYERMEKERVVELQERGSTITAQNIFTLIGELKKICNRDPVSGESVKLEWLRDNIREVCEAGDKALIFTQYREERFGGTEWLEKELKEYAPLNYSHATSDREKQRLLSNFETNPQHKIFLGNPRTAGLGLNQLVAANYVIHFDHWWNPAVTNQATARAHRPNQTKKVFVYHLWVEDTIEEVVLQKALAKQKLYNEVIDSLSSGISEELLFEIYDELLQKHGFKPIGLVSKPQKEPSIQKPMTVSTTQSPRDFEFLVGRLFEAMGFKARVTPASKDGGVDVIAIREIGASLEKHAIQCKFQTSRVGRPVLQQLLGVITSDPSFTKGILVTNSDFSRDALDYVKQTGRLQLISGQDLQRLLQQYKVN